MEVVIVQETCFKCNIVFWITKEHHDALVKCKNDFYCPNGHGQHYLGESNEEKLSRMKNRIDELNEEKQKIHQSNVALRGVITRMKKKKGA